MPPSDPPDAILFQNALFLVVAADSRGEPTRSLGAKDAGRQLAGYHAYHATRADLLRRLVRSQKSRVAYDKAIQLAGNTST